MTLTTRQASEIRAGIHAGRADWGYPHTYGLGYLGINPFSSAYWRTRSQDPSTQPENETKDA